VLEVDEPASCEISICKTLPDGKLELLAVVSIVPVEAGTVTVKLLAVFVGTSSMLPPLVAASLSPI
jgi:hypothetical protein